MSPEERQRAADFRLLEPRERFVITRGALRVLLGRYLDAAPTQVSITVDSNNKPRLADTYNASDLRFNVAHSGHLALIAVTSEHEIGVDVERLREVRHAEHIARRFFHPAEIASIVAATPANRNAAFLQCWTGKEAVLKAIGSGITGLLGAFRVPIVEDVEQGVWVELPTLSHAQPAQCWLRWLDPDDDYSAAVAVVGPRINLRCMTLTP
jgi:4'-phosphopantetheinyl transferase